MTNTQILSCFCEDMLVRVSDKDQKKLTKKSADDADKENGKVMDGFCVDKCESDPKIKRIR